MLTDEQAALFAAVAWMSVLRVTGGRVDDPGKVTLRYATTFADWLDDRKRSG